MSRAPKLFESDDDTYGRYVHVRHSVEPCMKCGQKPTIEIDTSDYEYLAAVFCQHCLASFFTQL